MQPTLIENGFLLFRSNCYANFVFKQCLDDLLMVDAIDEYVNTVQLVGK